MREVAVLQSLSVFQQGTGVSPFAGGGVPAATAKDEQQVFCGSVRAATRRKVSEHGKVLRN